MTSSSKHLASDRVMIMAAPNGARRTHHDHPNLPMTAKESAAEARDLVEAGVSILHLHVRDRDGNHSIDPDLYREATAAVRDAVGDELVIQVTTEAVGRYQPAEQMACVRDLQPEAVSLALRELCPDDSQVPTFRDFCEEMRERGVWPQYILYSPEDVARFETYIADGVFADEAPFAMLVVGAYSPARNGTPTELAGLVTRQSSRYPWAVCCFGKHEQSVACAAYAQGGHVRLGFENNLTMADGTRAADNAALIRDFVAQIDLDLRQPANANEVREAFL
ncbi:MAG: 3-keto-5-aminohexanoate cleavage protein [Pseudomonadota bacterium]